MTFSNIHFVVILLFISKSLCGSISILSNADSASIRNVPEMWSHHIFWDYLAIDKEISKTTLVQYPFLRTVEFFTATGGCYKGFETCSWNRDLFVDPKDPSKGYNFSPLLNSVSWVVNAGLQPYIVTGNVPISFSQNPVIGAFGVNTQPPRNFTEYSEYISGLAAAAVSKFGIDSVRGWKWGVLTEFNNPDWYTNSTEDYLKLYDFTVCGLTKVLGVGINIGAHGCTQCERVNGENGWDPLMLIYHAKTGNNYCTGSVGTPITFLSNSYYERTPGNPGDLSGFDQVQQFRNKAASIFPDIIFGIDEGRILFGRDNEPLATRAVGASYQASFDAMLFWKMVYGNMDYYARWGITSNGGNGIYSWNNDVDTVATQVAQLSHKMVGEKLLEVSIGPGATNTSFIQAVSTLNPASNIVHILAFRHPFTFESTSSDTVNVKICGLKNTPRNLAHWIVDDTHSNFWPQWQEDIKQNKINSFYPGWSPDCEQVWLTNSTQEAYFKSRVPTYQKLAALSSSTDTFVFNGGCATFSAVFNGHAVHMWELV